MIGLTSHAQNEIMFTGGHLQAMEHIGSDIKNGFAGSIRGDYDFFKKSKFDFGPTASFHMFTDIKSDIEVLNAENVPAVGLNMGVHGEKAGFKAAYQVPTSEAMPLFKSVLSGHLHFGNKVRWKIGADYFFNRHLFHYTYTINTGISFKL